MLGILLFIISEAMLFGSFFTAYFFIRVVQNEDFPPAPFDFPVVVASVNTAILVSSSFTVHYALHSIKNGNRRGLQVGLATTFLLGSMFLFTQVNEYVKAGFSISDGAFASVFYGLTGLHGAHVFVGLTLLAIMNVRTWRRHFTPEAHMGVECAGIYWHFVDVMWIIVWSTVYLL
jgi:cytochrome c oxidase subunit 3